MKKYLILLLAVCISAVSLSAQSPDIKELIQLANQGNASAQYSLGLMYDKARRVPQDILQAMKWYRLSADQGNALAQFNLGAMYANGEGVRQDYVQAHKWFTLASDQGNENGKKYKDIVATKMTPQQIAQAQELARNWKSKK